MEETSLDRDTDLIQEYVDLLDRRAAKPSPFGKIAAGQKLGALRALLARAAARHPDPELERAAAAAAAEATSSRWRRVATSYWGSRLLMALAAIGGQQIVLLVLFLVALAYTDLTARPVDPARGVQWAPAQLSVVFLILFVFTFFFVTPLLSILLMWGGRYFRSWRKTLPATLLLLLAAAAFTWLTFRGTQNPAYAKDSIHQFAETRQQPYKSYEQFL
jgi:hypothetical protein